MEKDAKYLDYLGGVLIICNKDVEVEFCSSQSNSILGYAPSMIESTSGFWLSKIHSNHINLFNTALENSKSCKKDQLITYLFQVSKGDYLWVQSRITCVDSVGEQQKLSIFTTDFHEEHVEFEKKEEERLRGLALQHNSTHMFCLITQEGRFVQWNYQLVEASGYSNTEMESINLFEFFAPEERSNVEAMIETTIKAGTTEMDALFVTKEGALKLGRFVTSRFNLKGEMCVSVTATDISNKKSDAEILPKNEQRLMSIIQEGAGLLAILDVKGNYRFVGSSYFNIVGYEVDFLVDKNIVDFFHPEDVHFILEDFSLIKTQKRITTAPYRFKQKDDSWLWMQSTMTNMLDDVNTQGIIFNSVDINNLIETQKALNESNKRYETVNKVTNDAIYDWDIVNDLFSFGEGFSRIFGYDVQEDFKIKDWIAIEHPRDRERHLAAWEAFLSSSNRFKWYSEIRIKHQNGNYIYAEDIGHIIRDSSGQPIRMIGVLRDVSARRAQEVQNEIQYEIAELFAQDLSLEEILTQTSSYIARKFNAPIVEFWLNSNDGQSTHKVAYFSQTQISDSYAVFADENIACPNGASMPGALWDGSKILIWSGSKLKDNFLRKKMLDDLSIESVIGVPLLSKTSAIGQLVFLFQNNDLDDKEWIVTLDFLSKQLGDETARKIKEIEFELFYSSAPDILAVIGSEGQFVKVNPSFCSLLGYSAEEIKSKPSDYFLHPDDISDTSMENMSVKRSVRDEINFLNRYRTKSGVYRWISWSYSNTINLDNCFFAYGRDVTQIIELQNMLDSAANLSKIGAWEFNVENKQYYWSTMMRKIHGVSKDFNVTELNAFSFFRDDFKDLMTETFERCMNDFVSFDVEVVITKPNGKDCWVRIIGGAEVIREKCFRIFGSMQDIDVQKKNEYKLINLNTELQKNMHDLKASNKELEQFAYVASHDLQEPLRMVSSFLSLLDKKYKNDLDEKAQSYIQFAVGGAERMRSIILDLLEFSRAGLLDTARLSKVDLNVVIADVQILLKKQIEEAGATFNSSHLPVVYGDHSRLRQVFQNLISNALKYRDPHRSLIVSISSEQLDQSFTIRLEDNGIGIDEKYNNKIFELFQRLHNREQYSGNGIGLSITKKIIESYGGEIYVESRVGEGSVFTIKLKQELEQEN